MFEPDELHWGIKALFEAHEPIEYLPRLAFRPLTPDVRAEDFHREAVWCRERFDRLARRSPVRSATRNRTTYLRQWRKVNAEKWNAYRREWRARKRAA